jgi:hypothetical protein
MRLRWRLILPCLGLLLFAMGSYDAFHKNREHSNNHKYFWWSSLRLDRDPLNSHPEATTPCKDEDATCVQWEPGMMWVEPGWMAKLLVLSSAPALILGMLLVRVLGRGGIDEVSSFMVTMPMLLGAWYFLVGWFVDRWLYKRTLRL